MKSKFLLILLLLPCPVFSQDDPAAIEMLDSTVVVVAPPTSVMAVDHKYDKGERIDLTWVPSIDDQLVEGKVLAYRIYRMVNDGEPEAVADVPTGPGPYQYADEDLHRDSIYSYYVAAVSAGYEAVSTRTAPMSPQREWLNLDRKWLFLIALIVGGSVLLFITAARRGTKLFVRKIAGLEAVDEAVGRATEMGRPILFVPGIRDMDDVQTLAALTILGRVARVIADYDTRIFMPTSRSLVMTAGRETVKAAYQAAGRPDKYNDDMVTYYTDEQFGYVAAVDGVMVREKPATVFLLGAFFAESLILAETGNYIGAIQIGGTARPAQLPFFIAACDFTLIGEELFAASAYLSGEPMQLGSLKGQDVGKAIAMIAIIVGAVAITIGEAWDVEFMHDIVTWMSGVFSTR